MLVFPQLSSGGCAQYPFKRTRERRISSNTLADGSRLLYADTGTGRVKWAIPFVALSSQEAASIQNLFDAAEGRLRTFTFLDPGANLLSWSADLTQAAWRRDPGLQLTAGVTDPMGGNKAFRLVNNGQVPQKISQTLQIPGWFIYTLSVYARSGSGSSIRLERSAGTAAATASFELGADWIRLDDSGALASNSETVTAGVELPAGAAVELFGIQLEAQPAPSTYLASEARNGVYQGRFDQDALPMTAQAPDRNDLHIRIIAPDGA